MAKRGVKIYMDAGLDATAIRQQLALVEDAIASIDDVFLNSSFAVTTWGKKFDNALDRVVLKTQDLEKVIDKFEEFYITLFKFYEDGTFYFLPQLVEILGDRAFETSEKFENMVEAAWKVNDALYEQKQRIFELAEAYGIDLAGAVEVASDEFQRVWEETGDAGKALQAFSRAMIESAVTTIRSIGQTMIVEGMLAAGSRFFAIARGSSPALIAKGAAVKGMAGQLRGLLAGRFAEGGIVGGNSPVGDKLLARVNSGEVILNAAQQRAALAQMARGSNQVPNVNIKIENHIAEASVTANQDADGTVRLIIQNVMIEELANGPEVAEVMRDRFGIKVIGR